MGLVYFCLAIQKLLVSLKSELVGAYLDDITLGGDAETVSTDFEDLEKHARDLGLSLNQSKCEIIGAKELSKDILRSHNIVLIICLTNVPHSPFLTT